MALDKKVSKFEAKRSNVKVTGNENVKKSFPPVSSSKVARLTSNQDENDQRHILHSHIVEYIAPDSACDNLICNYPRRPHVAEVFWLCTLFNSLRQLLNTRSERQPSSKANESNPPLPPHMVHSFPCLSSFQWGRIDVVSETTGKSQQFCGVK